MDINEDALRKLLRILTDAALDGDPTPTSSDETELGLTDRQIAELYRVARDVEAMWDAAAAWTDGRVSFADLAAPVVQRAGLLVAIASTRGAHLRTDGLCSCDEGCADCTPTTWHDGDGDASLPIFEEDVADEQPF